MKATKQLYKYYRMNECEHFVHSLVNNTYVEEIHLRDNDALSADLAESLPENDPIAVYFQNIGQEVEHAFENEYLKLNSSLKSQQTFVIDGVTFRPDLIAVNDETMCIDLIEVKSTTNKNWFSKEGKVKSGKLKNLYDLEFQYHLLKIKFPDYNISAGVGVIDTINWPTRKFTVIDLTDHMCAKVTFNAYCTRIENIISEGMSSINPDTSKSKCLYGPECGKCSDASGKVYDNYDIHKVQRLLDTYPLKLAMIDFETINNPLPKDKWYRPYDKVVVQLSTHLVKGDELILHEEFLATDTSKEQLNKMYNMMVRYVEEGYQMVAYYKSFEKSCLNTMSDILGRNELRDYPLLDLFDFFKKQSKDNLAPISFKEWGSSASIKKTINYAYDSNPYTDGTLKITNGGAAMAELYRGIIKGEEVNRDDLLAYCEQDTLTMVELFWKIVDEFFYQSTLVEDFEHRITGCDEVVGPNDGSTGPQMGEARPQTLMGQRAQALKEG